MSDICLENIDIIVKTTISLCTDSKKMDGQMENSGSIQISHRTHSMFEKMSLIEAHKV